jgi:hypothetical protein
MTTLSIEQQFALRMYAESIKNADREDLEQLLIELIRLKMIQEALLKDLMKAGL